MTNLTNQLALTCENSLLAVLTSRKCREFQALCLMACLGATTLLGLVLYWSGSSSEGEDGKIPSTGTIVAASSTGVLTFAALTLLLVSCLVPHFSFNHRTIVRGRAQGRT